MAALAHEHHPGVEIQFVEDPLNLFQLLGDEVWHAFALRPEVGASQ